jgi:hypothetical protein
MLRRAQGRERELSLAQIGLELGDAERLTAQASEQTRSGETGAETGGGQLAAVVLECALQLLQIGVRGA